MGEGGWSALEIIIVLILVIALLGRIFGTGTAGISSKKSTTSKAKEETVISKKTCGKLLVVTPVSLQKISSASSGMPVEATIESCSFSDTAYSGSYIITVVDSAATPIADPISVPIRSNGKVYGFSQFVPFVATPKAGTGYLIITRTTESGANTPSDGARLPIRFVN